MLTMLASIVLVAVNPTCAGTTEPLATARVPDVPRWSSCLVRPDATGDMRKSTQDDDWIPLFNGEDLSGWRIYTSDQLTEVVTWRVADGRIVCTGEPSGYLATERAYQDFVLELEWRWPAAPGNSGVLLRTIGPDRIWPSSLEAQLMHANAGDFWKIGQIEANTEPERTRAGGRNCRKLLDAEHPPGQWNTYKIVCVDDTVSLFINGRLVNGATQVSRRPGRICLQSEGAPIEFRKIRIRVLD